MSEDMDYWQAVDVLSSLVHRRGDPEECRAYLVLMEEIIGLRNELRELRSRPRRVQIGDYDTQTNRHVRTPGSASGWLGARRPAATLVDC